MVAAPTVPVNANDEEFKDSSVKSYARLRPRLSGTENGKTWIEDPVELEYTHDKIMNKGRIGSSSSCNKNKVQTLRFFNRVFGPDMNNEEIFQEMVVPMLNNVVKGFPSVLIAYGQTGSGKTYSMLGVGEKSGMGLLDFSTKWLRQRSDNQSITLSAVEVYGIHGTRVAFYDLFKQPRKWIDKMPLKALGMASTMVLNSDEDCKEAILKAHASSHFAPTARNPQSSRGHICFKVTYTKGRKESSFVIVDLAGSEGMSDLKKPTKGSDSDDQPTKFSFEMRKMEAGIIKNGLGELRGMISELKRRKIGKSRGTGLRQLLFEHVTGNTILSFLFTIAPSKMHSTATENTLRVADSVSQIKKKVTRIADKGPKAGAKRLAVQENEWLRKGVELRDLQLMKQKSEIGELKKRLHHVYYLAYLAASKQSWLKPEGEDKPEGEEGAPHPLQVEVDRMRRELDEKERQIQSYKAEMKDMVDRHSEENFLVDSMVSMLAQDLKKKIVDIDMLRKVDQGYRGAADSQLNERRALVFEGHKSDVEYSSTPEVDSVGSETDPENNSPDLSNLAGLRHEALKCLTMRWPVTPEGKTSGCSPSLQ